jgi:SAM-dependent methyltransferase
VTVPGPAAPIGNLYDKYHTSNPVERWMMERFLSALDGCLDQVAPSRVLEIGVGEGHVTARVRRRFPGATIIGLDLPAEELHGHWEGTRVVGVFGDATRLPFPDGTFDLVMAIEVLEHIHHPERALNELARVGTGPAIFSVPFEPIWRAGNIVRGRYVKAWGNTPGHVNHWTSRSFRRFIEQQFHIRRVVSPIPWTMALVDR